MAQFLSRLTGAASLALLMGAAPAAAIDLPFGWGNSRAPSGQEAPVILAQSSDASVRISQMEEEMRRLTGKVEEMSFLVLQLQEQLRNAQEDNELRFQDLEGGSSSGGNGERRSEAAPAPGTPSSGDQEFALGLPPVTPPTSATSPAQNDEIGSILGSAAATGLPQPGSGSSQPAPSSTVASIDPSGPAEMYSLAYNYLLAGDYQLAEQTFRRYADTYPDSAEAADARYWLGESLFAQNKFRDAAEVFLNAQKAHPDSGKAPEMMLKLGMSLARLDNRDTACVTYAEVERRYPQMSENVRRKLGEEERTASCS